VVVVKGCRCLFVSACRELVLFWKLSAKLWLAPCLHVGSWCWFKVLRLEVLFEVLLVDAHVLRIRFAKVIALLAEPGL
jgi:uncharacterized membrane protein